MIIDFYIFIVILHRLVATFTFKYWDKLSYWCRSWFIKQISIEQSVFETATLFSRSLVIASCVWRRATYHFVAFLVFNKIETCWKYITNRKFPYKILKLCLVVARRNCGSNILAQSKTIFCNKINYIIKKNTLAILIVPQTVINVTFMQL